MIEKTHNRNPDNSQYGTEGGKDTDDFIFLLSLEEVENVSEDIRAEGSDWWLRSPGDSQDYAALVWSGGGVAYSGYDVDSSSGVRPALNLKF